MTADLSSGNLSGGNAPDWDAIARFLADESTPAEASAVRAWLDAHPRERALLERLDAAAQASPADVDVEAALARVHERIASTTSSPKLTVSRGGVSPNRIAIFTIVATAAAAAIVVIALRPRETNTHRNTARTYATAVGQRDSVLLADGSRVTLGPRSTLVVPADYATHRALRLTGDAYFDVHHDTARPFSVAVDNVVVEDIGTRFSVESDAVDETSVAVVSGSVRLRAGGTPAASGVVLEAGDRGDVDSRGRARVEQLSLRDALDRIATLAKLRVSYSAELLPLDRAVCVQATDEPAGRALADVLAGTNVAPISVGGDQVVLAPRRDTASHHDAPEMSTSLGVLDRVVVTGSATGAGAPARELPVDLTVVDGRDLEKTNTNTLSDALDMYVPGVWGWAQSPNSLISSYASIRGASSFGLSYPKIYIDGIEVANPLLVSRFNPGTVDHIEVIRGPQGSALYGVDAISGVVNIVTRHDGAVDGTNMALRGTAGFAQSAFAHSVLAQDHAFSLATGSALNSFDLNVSGSTMGAFVPNGSSRDLLATASARTVTSHSTLSGTARFYAEQAGSADSPLVARPATPGTLEPSTPQQSVNQYTVGATATTSPNDRMTHTLVVGVDGYRLDNVQTNFT